MRPRCVQSITRVLRPFLIVLQLAHIGQSFTIYAALGDSYASGDGAGSSKLLPHLDPLCARFDHAYPVLIANDERLHLPAHGFKNMACGGALTTTILKTQVPWIGDSDLITMQVGGNEIDFFGLLNECIQQWQPLSTCDRELARSRSLAQDSSFLDRYNFLVAETVKKMQSHTRLLLIGYARFFNDQSEQCDHISFSKTDPANTLTRHKRRRLNEVVLLLNDVIRAAAEAHGSTYIDIDQLFEGHRFCEEGVVEPKPDASWFFNNAGRPPPKLPDVDEAIRQQVLPNPFRRFLNLTQTFHPTAEAHQAIADEILRSLLNGAA